MKLIALTVKNVRGLPDLHLPLDGNSVAIWGPNGTGKSGVVDAIDFLFTGEISRLRGEGTGGITLSQHGPHIDAGPESALVTATLRLNGVPNNVEISRCMAQPKTLLCSERDRPVLDDIANLMQRGSVILTRRHILRYVTAKAAKRSEEIQELLHLEKVESIRKSLTKARNELKQQKKSAQIAIENAKADVNVFLEGSDYSDESLVKTVNECRRALGGGTLDSHMPTAFQDGLKPPAAVARLSASNDPEFFLQTMENIRRDTSLEAIAEFNRNGANLRKSLSILEEDPALQSEFEQLELSRIAARFIDHSTIECPVCGSPWTEGHLKAHIDNKIATAQTAEGIRKRIAEAAGGLSGPGQNLRANVDFLEENLRQADFGAKEEDFQFLTSWRRDLGVLLEALNGPVETHFSVGFSGDDISSNFVPHGLKRVLDRIESTAIDVLPQRSKQQTAWDKLTKLELSVQVLERRRIQKQSAKRVFIRSEILLTAFESARDSVLEELYSRVSERFTEYYRVLHENEKENFVAQLQPQGAALTLGVDFLGRGSHPPQALHSEGHQDSMGICLFLALNEELANGRVGLIVLDDVVMSIDSGHRKALCRLLREWFPDRQFVITTHDKTWAKQLMHEKVVDADRVTEFTNWTVEGGPIAHLLKGMWDDIQADLERENVPNAAFRLRNGSEEFFESVCDALGAKLKYNSQARWEFGEWVSAAMSEYRSLLKEATKAASSWGKEKEVVEFRLLESLRSKVFRQVSIEQWTINPNVHFNRWANMSVQDFSSVVDTFKRLHGLFLCADCGGLMEKTLRKGTPETVKCRCNAVNWNLRRKS